MIATNYYWYYWQDTTGTSFMSGALPTGHWLYPVMDYYPVSRWPEFKIEIPKWWRWFDVFRTWKDATVKHFHKGFGSLIFPISKAVSTAQRMRQKRRAYIQKLRSA